MSTALERGILRSLRDYMSGRDKLEKRVDRLEDKVVTLEGKVRDLEQPAGDYGPPELLERLKGIRSRLQAIR